MTERVIGNWWVQNLFRPALIAGMMVCLAAPPVQILEWIMGDWNGTYFLVFCFVASLEGILSERALRKRRIAGWAYLASRIAEALILLLLLKLANYIPLGLDQLQADAQRWLSDPYAFLTGLDFFTGGVFLLLWTGSLYVARMVSELDVDESKAPPPEDKTSTEYYLWLTQPSVVRERQEVLDWLGEVFVWGGMAILLASAVIHAFVASARALAVPTLLYFALGVALLSQARFSVSYAGWLVQGIPVQRGIARRWLVWTVLFLVGMALVALLLPTRYAMGPILALLGVLDIIVWGVMQLLFLIYFVLVLLLSLLFPGVKPPERPPQVIEQLPAVEPTPVTSSLPWLEILLSALFWTLILGIVGYALLRFFRDRFGSLAEGEEEEASWWGRFLAWLRTLWWQWRAWRQEVQVRLAQRRARRRRKSPGIPGVFRFLSLGRLSPRELVRYFYLSAAKRATQAGQPRRPGQTPYEYRASLAERFPELEPDLTGLTDAFVGARYSRQPVEQEDAKAVKPLWQRIKTALRRRRTRWGEDNERE